MPCSPALRRGVVCRGVPRVTVQVLEIAANSLASALAAQAGGAGRVELCAALELGGLTPSHATIAAVRRQLRIPLYVLIRPRAGDFVCATAELAVMRGDIATCTALGCDGVVFGALDADGDVDRAACRGLMAAAGSMGVTFHRAFDVCRDRREALETIIALGCERVLTSGGACRALDGAATIRALVAQAAGRIVIMPGAGIDACGLAALVTATGASEYHASASRMLPSRMHHPAPPLAGLHGGELRSDITAVRALASVLRAAG